MLRSANLVHILETHCIVPWLCLSAGSMVTYMKTYTKLNCEIIVVGQKRKVVRDASNLYWIHMVYLLGRADFDSILCGIFTELAPRYRLKAKYQLLSN